MKKLLRLILVVAAISFLGILAFNHINDSIRSGQEYNESVDIKALKESVTSVCDEASFTLETIRDLTSSAWGILSGHDPELDPDEAVEELEKLWDLVKETRYNLGTVDEIFDDYL